MSVYCETCKECICHECALWSTEHHGHSFKPLDILYKKHVEILQGEVRKEKGNFVKVLSCVFLIIVSQIERPYEGYPQSSTARGEEN